MIRSIFVSTDFSPPAERGVAGRASESPMGRAVTPFLMALARAETYSLSFRRNPYALFGFLWGLPVPIVTVGVHCWATGGGSCRDVLALLAAHPWQFFFVAHPILFAVVFGAMGTVAADDARRIDALVARLERLAGTDMLTGLANRRAFTERLSREAARLAREGKPMTALMIDLDFFKRFNDRFGHAAGDRVLQAVAGAIARAVRPGDIVCRWGGEEFAVALPGLAAEEATRSAERLRQAVSALAFPFLPAAQERAERTTLSIGIATRRSDEPVDAWMARADARLYEAKRSGRDRVCV